MANQVYRKRFRFAHLYRPLIVFVCLAKNAYHAAISCRINNSKDICLYSCIFSSIMFISFSVRFSLENLSINPAT
jgi:hypothetical protein